MRDVRANSVVFHVTQIEKNAKDFNPANYYNETEISDMVRTLKESNYQGWQQVKLAKVFTRAFKTLAQLMSYMNQQINFPLITQKYDKVNAENTIKLLLRCNNLLEARRLAYRVLKDIIKFEKQIRNIRNQVDEYLDTMGSTADLKTKIKNASAQALTKLTEGIIDNIATLRDDHKIFSKMRATTSKGHHVVNVMVFKRRDAMKYVLREYDSIKRLV
jgi:conjugal transfer/entry exclusion protein